MGWNRLALFDASPDAGLIEPARDAFRRAFALRPDLAEAYLGFGATYLMEAEPSRGGDVALTRAWHMLPHRPLAPYLLSLLQLRTSQDEEAAATIETALAADAPGFLELLAADLIDLLDEPAGAGRDAGGR